MGRKIESRIEVRDGFRTCTFCGTTEARGAVLTLKEAVFNLCARCLDQRILRPGQRAYDELRNEP